MDGKVRALSKLLRDNFGFVMQGVGVVVPIFATYDGNSKPEARLYFYDAMGAQFEVTEYAATGSGSPACRRPRGKWRACSNIRSSISGERNCKR